MPAAVQRRFEEVVVRSIIWGFVGGIFGALFIGFKQTFITYGLNDSAMIPAAALAGAVGAAFYGSLRVALFGTLAGVLTAVGYLLVVTAPNPAHLAMVAGACGLAFGFVYGLMNPSVSGALMKALTGLIAGALAGSILWYPMHHGLQVSEFLVAGLLAPLTGVFYVFGVFNVVDRLQCKLPLPLVGALVAGILSIVVAESLWVIREALVEAVDAIAIRDQNGSFSELLGCVTCALTGGAIAGGSFALMGLRWLDRE